MPAVSKKQQQFFGIVRAIQKGEQAPTTPETAKAAADMKKSDVKKFASTKHKGLPNKVVQKEEDNFSQRDTELKKTKSARDQRFKSLHKSTNTGSNVDVNENVKRDEYGDPIGGPKISKKKRKKNLSTYEGDDKNV